MLISHLPINSGQNQTTLRVIVHKKEKKAKYVFTEKEMIVTGDAEIHIDAMPGSVEDEPEYEQPEQLGIVSYCCTETSLDRVHVNRKWVTKKGETPSTSGEDGFEVAKIDAVQNAKLYEANADYIHKIGLKILLAPRQMVFVGIIVEVLRSGVDKPEYYLCDPQVGNGPPGTGNFIEALLLVPPPA
ncbi:MAG: hypothetical protein KF800_08555 [Lysobacter sp.]|nr:hypothetical protein [Lysobacter sp.]